MNKMPISITQKERGGWDLIQHTRSLTKLAVGAAKSLEEMYGITVNYCIDYCNSSL